MAALLASVVGLIVFITILFRLFIKYIEKYVKQVESLNTKVTKLERRLLKEEDMRNDCKRRERRLIRRYKVLEAKYLRMLEVVNKLALDKLTPKD